MTIARQSDLVTSMKVLIEAQAAEDSLRAELKAAQARVVSAMQTVQLAQQAVMLDMPKAGEAVTVRVSQTDYITATVVHRPASGRPALKLVRSIAARAAA